MYPRGCRRRPDPGFPNPGDPEAGQFLDTADGEPLMIVVPLDQAEELFTGDIPEATGLLTLINGLALDSDTEARLPLIVAATIRTDRYDRLQEALQGTDLQTEKFDLCAMDVTQFENVVTGPARRSTDSGRPCISTSNWYSAYWPTHLAAPTRCRFCH